MKYIKPLNEKKPKGAPDFHHSDAPDAEGRFRDLGIKDLAAWLIKTRKGDVKKISGSLTQQVVFNRNEDPEYAEKMEKVRKEVYKQLDRQDLIDKMDESVNEGIGMGTIEPFLPVILAYIESGGAGRLFYKIKKNLKAIPKVINNFRNMKDITRILNKLEKHPKINGYLNNLDPEGVEVMFQELSMADMKIMYSHLGLDWNPKEYLEIKRKADKGEWANESVLNEEDSYNDYPAAAKKNAQMAIDWKEKYGRDEVPAGTPVGWARAHQLAKGEKISADTVKRMSAFNRHRKNSKIAPEHKDTPWKDNGYVAWLIWGGDEGVDWAIEKSKEIDAMKESKQMKYIKPLNEAERKFKKGDKIEYKQLFGMGSKQEWTTLTGVVMKVKNKKKSPLGTLAPHQELTLKSGAVVSPYNNHKDIKLAEDNELTEATVTLHDLELSGFKKSKFDKHLKKHNIKIDKEEVNSGGYKEITYSAKSKDALMFLFKAAGGYYPDGGVQWIEESAINEGYWSGYDYSKWTKENGKPKYPKWVKVTLKEIVKGGFMDPVYDSEHMYMVLWLGSFDNQRRAELSAYDKKGIKEFGKVGYKLVRDRWNDLTGYNMFFMMGAMYALEVSKQIEDRIANGEPVEPAYYMMKEYFNNFGMDTKRSRIFNAAYEKLEKWMKDNNIKTL